MTQFLPETAAMLRNVIAQVKENTGKTHAEAVALVVAELLKTEPAQAVQAKKDLATGPAPQEWQPAKGGWWRRDGRFVPDETWKPTAKPTETPREDVPDVASQGTLITHTKNTGSLLGVAKDGRVRDLNATGGAIKVEWQPPVGGHYEPYGPNGTSSRWVTDQNKED
jgi:hypothetical protein